MENNFRSLQRNRKAFCAAAYESGSKAEKFMIKQIESNPESFGITNLKKTLIVKNPDPYGVDILILKQTNDRLWEPYIGIEVMIRKSINCPKIFIESNKLRYSNDVHFPTWFVIVNAEYTEALVLSGENADLNLYETAVTNFNPNKSNEINVMVPREYFTDWPLESEAA